MYVGPWSDQGGEKTMVRPELVHFAHYYGTNSALYVGGLCCSRLLAHLTTPTVHVLPALSFHYQLLLVLVCYGGQQTVLPAMPPTGTCCTYHVGVLYAVKEVYLLDAVEHCCLECLHFHIVEKWMWKDLGCVWITNLWGYLSHFLLNAFVPGGGGGKRLYSGGNILGEISANGWMFCIFHFPLFLEF